MICMLTMTGGIFGQTPFKTSEDKEAFDYKVGETCFDFHSTSTMMMSGSNLPIAAQNGLSIDNDTPDENMLAQAEIARSIRRKVGPVTPDDDPTPVGDGTWVMLVMAMGFAGWMTLRRRRVMQAKCISIE